MIIASCPVFVGSLEAKEVCHATAAPPVTRMRTKLKKFVLLFLGWSFVLVGIVGLFLPILPGISFVLIGLLILSPEYAWVRQVLRKVRKRLPAAAQRFERASSRATTWLRHVFRRDRDSVLNNP